MKTSTCVLALLLLLASALPGCMTATYTDGASGTSVTIQKFAWETKIGHLEASNGASKIVVDNYDSESQAIELAKQAVKALAAMPKPLP